MSEWQPEATAPFEEPLLTICANIPGAIIPWVASKDEDGWTTFNCVRESFRRLHGEPEEYKPTHWMPLPEPPHPIEGAQ